MHAAIQGIPEEAAKRGVFPEDTLRERFLKVITALLYILQKLRPPRITSHILLRQDAILLEIIDRVSDTCLE